jgi:hypothetical protein
MLTFPGGPGRGDSRSGRGLDGMEPRRVLQHSTARAPAHLCRTGHAVGAVRRIAYDVTLEAGDALRRIRDPFAEYDENRAGDRGGE